MDGFAPAKIRNNIYLANDKSITIFRWGERMEAVFSSNNYYNNRVDRAASKSGAGEKPQQLESTEISIDPMITEGDFWNANFISKNSELKDVGPKWNWNWVKPEILTKK